MRILLKCMPMYVCSSSRRTYSRKSLRISGPPDEQNTSSYLRQDLPLVDHLSKTLTPFLDKRLTISKINELASLILAMPDFTDENLRTCQERGPGTFQRLIRDVQGKDSRKLRNQLRTIFLANRMPSALTACFRRLREIAQNAIHRARSSPQ
jgi:hypothetical protein